MKTLAVLLALAGTAAAEPCADAILATTRDPAVDDACLAQQPLAVVTAGVGLGGMSAGSGVWSAYATVDIPVGPLRIEGRGRLGGASTVEALVGYRIGYSYRPADVTWTTSHYIGSSGSYDYYAVAGHSMLSMVRDETVLVAGARGIVLPDNSVDAGKTFEFGIQHMSASGYNTHRRWELLGVLRGSSPGLVAVYDNAIPTTGRLVYGIEGGIVPYSAGMPASDRDDVYVVFDLGWSFEL